MKNWYERSPFDEIFAILRVSFFGCLLIGFLVLSDSSTSPRMMILAYFINFTVIVLLGRTISRRLQIKLRAKGIIAVYAMIIGTANEVLKLYQDILKSPQWGYKIVGIVYIYSENGNSEEKANIIPNIPTYTGLDGLDDALANEQPEEALIAADSPHHATLLKIVNTAADRNIRVKIVPDLYDYFTGQTRTMHIYGIPLIEISPQLLKPWQEVIKRLFDIFFSLAVILAGMPLWLLIALLVKIESKGPVFYKQTRMGKDGKEFKIHKFRSMMIGSDKEKQWTEVNDPRVTRIGKILRKTHLDEIPQFWDSLRGEMSIVGPRPEQTILVNQFSKDLPFYKRRLKVRPGITGWWQIQYQPYIFNLKEVENRLKDDFYYIENMSLKLDFEIIVRTVWCVLRGHGQA